MFAYLPDERTRADPADRTGRPCERSRDAGHPVITIPTRGPADLGRVFLLAELAVAVAGWGLQINPFDQPNVQQAKDATKRVLGRIRDDARAARDRRRRRRRAARAARRRRAAAATSRSWAMCSPRPSSTRPSPSCARRSATRRRRRRRSATARASCTRPASSTRAGREIGRFLQLMHDGPDDVEIPGAQLHVHDARRTPRRSATCETLRSLGLPAERVRLAGDRPGERAARTRPRRIKEMLLTQIGFVGLGKMGGNMVHRIRRDSEHEVVAFDFDKKAVKQARARTARPARPRCKELVKQLKAPRIVWIMVPAGDPTQQTVDKLAKLLDARRHDRRRRQLEVDRRQAPRQGAARARASTTSTSASPAACGGSRSATA